MSLRSLVLCFVLLSVTTIRGVSTFGADTPLKRPNILWLTCEDSSTRWFGCYGNREAKTPNIDRLAQSGFRYTHAYACAPVCAPSRSTWITGVYAVSMGTQPMRSRYLIPHGKIGYYPDFLRRAGYLAANHTKTDYNIGGRPDGDCWDSNKRNAWKAAGQNQPFFQILNYTSSHESSAHGDVTGTKHPPNEVTLTKFHPDELGIRQTYAKYYDAVEKMDSEIGDALNDLDKSGLADDTIVIFNSDHGGVMPRSKRFLYNSGVHSPLIVRIPEKYQQWWPAERPGMTVDRLVSFIDMPKTWLSLAGAEVPKEMQGTIFLGPGTEPEPKYAYSFRERMDERYDHSRSVRDKRFAYIKNYMPFVPWGQHLDYLWKMQATRSWDEAFQNGRTDAVTGKFFQTKPVEELYDMDADPDNVTNLAERPEHRQTIERMRSALRDWQLAVHDSGLLPESERERRAAENKTTIYELVRDPKLYNLSAYLDAADVALANSEANRKQLVSYLKHDDSAIRFWGMIGLVMLGNNTESTRAAVEAVLDDSCGETRALAAMALLPSPRAQQTLIQLLDGHSAAALMALNVIDWAHADTAPFESAMTALLDGKGTFAEYDQRMVEFFRSKKSPSAPKSK